MNTRVLVPLAWTLLSITFAALLFGLYRAATDRTPTPEAGRGLGVIVVGILIAVVAVLGVLLYVAVRKQSRVGLITLVIVLGWPVFVLIATPIWRAWQAYRVDKAYTNEQARIGDFADPALAAMAAAIVAGDTDRLASLLGGKPPPPGVDRAGNDLLAFALVHARDRNGSSGPVRVLLEAGADLRQTRVAPPGQDPLHYVLGGFTTDTRKEIVKLLIDHGADVNARDIASRNTPLGSTNDVDVVRWLVERGADIDALQADGAPAIVGLIGNMRWDAALYLIEKGANLDGRSVDGRSVDFYFNNWATGVNDSHPEKWFRVREAIAARRGQSPN